MLPAAKAAQEKMHAKPLFNGGWLQDEIVKQDEHAYFSFELRERKVLVITVETQHGDADIFVSNDTHTPSQAEHSWRSAGSGDDVVEVSPDHPRYAYPCAYYVAVRGARSDSEFNIRATLEDVPFRLNMNARTPETNGFRELSSLVSRAEERRFASRFRSPRDEYDMGGEVKLETYDGLPPQIQAVLQAGAKKLRLVAEAAKNAEEAAKVGANPSPSPSPGSDPGPRP